MNISQTQITFLSLHLLPPPPIDRIDYACHAAEVLESAEDLGVQRLDDVALRVVCRPDEPLPERWDFDCPESLETVMQWAIERHSALDGSLNDGSRERA